MQFLSKDPWLTDVSSTIVREVQQAMPNLLSFSPSVVDQSTWERLSGVSIKHEGSEPICEVNLFALVRNFVGTISTSVIMGSAFTEAFPYALNELWTFDECFNAMLLGIPRWVPFPGLVSSYAARRRLLLALKTFHNAFAATEIGIDPGFDWRDMDDVSEVIKARARPFIEAGYTPEQAASEHLCLFWTMNMTTNTLIFWNLVHILSDSDLHEKIVEEIKAYSNASRPDWRESGFNIPEPPRLNLSLEGLVSACPLLKATYYEVLRLHFTLLSYLKLKKDVTLVEPTEAALHTVHPLTTYRCDAGSYIAIPHFVHNLNPECFPEPDKFYPQRFLAQDSEEALDASDEAPSLEHEKLIPSESISLKIHDIWPNELSYMLSCSREFAERQALVFTAAFLMMWDIQRADGKPWEVPRHKNGSATHVPKKDIRVRMNLKV
ncbi:hypothetical protein PRK78_007300 [Emydomyces testavorans]|uniref:Cytochrome P450 n=1 Tax=Emydomyces testavorans TaxID=2070801 RepID=A0AAF0DP16_9EURO|nr:hypothetical protein PRK78_007300 [Emydomyces testavorans]